MDFAVVAVSHQGKIIANFTIHNSFPTHTQQHIQMHSALLLEVQGPHRSLALLIPLTISCAVIVPAAPLMGSEASGLFDVCVFKKNPTISFSFLKKHPKDPPMTSEQRAKVNYFNTFLCFSFFFIFASSSQTTCGCQSLQSHSEEDPINVSVFTRINAFPSSLHSDALKEGDRLAASSAMNSSACQVCVV